jgi:hypothetical protein
MSTQPMIPNTRALEAGLMSLLASLTTTLSRVHDVPALSASSFTTLTKSLAKYLTFSISRNRRRSRTSLDPSNLAFNLLRTRNSSETTVRDAGKKVKGEKNWYYLVLSEIDRASDTVQILVEGMIRREKGEVLDGFVEEVDDQVLFWEELENEENEEMRLWVDMEKEVDGEREGKTKADRWAENQREVVRERKEKAGKKGRLEDIEEDLGES